MGADLSIIDMYFMGDMPDKERERYVIAALNSETRWDPELWGDIAQYSGDGADIGTKGFLQDRKKEVKDFFECLSGRDVNEILAPGGKIFLTGGMSWGDSPSEAYDIFEKVCRLPDHILAAGNINIELNAFEYLMGKYKDEMPKKLKTDLDKFRVTLEI